MMYIEKIELKNFQSHKDSVIEFTKGLNVILGTSDSGKTAIIRAIKWALFNEPLGDYFIRQGENKTSVTVYFNNGVVVRRFRSSSKNTYYLKRQNGEEMNFSGFKSDVPKEILEETKMYKASFDASNDFILNIAEQLEGPFLLNLQPSLRATAIGRLVHADLVDNALKDTATDISRIKKNIKSLSSEKKERERQVSQFDYLENLEAILNKVKSIRDRINLEVEKLNNLKRKKEYLDKLNFEINKIKTILYEFENLNDVENIYNEINYKCLKIKNINRLNENFNKVIYNIKNLINSLEKLKNLSELEEILKMLLNNSHKLNIYTDLYNKYINNLKKLNITKTELDNYKNIAEIKNIFDKLLSKISLYNKLNNIDKNLRLNISSIKKGEKILLDGFNNLEDINNQFIVLTEKLEILKNLMELKNTLKIIDSSIKDVNKDLSQNNKYLEEKSKEYEEFILKIGICPFCYNSIDKSSIEHLKKHLRSS